MKTTIMVIIILTIVIAKIAILMTLTHLITNKKIGGKCLDLLLISNNSKNYSVISKKYTLEGY